jgi:insertion element IS1 protein InsB
MTVNAMTPPPVMGEAECISLESPVPSKGHAGFGRGSEETCHKATRLAPTLLDATSRQVIAFHVGDRSRTSARRLWMQIPQAYSRHATFYTDQYVVYVGVIPAAQHKAIHKLARKTTHIERFNNTLRQRMSRLVRETLSFSKKLANHIGAIKYFICVRRVKLLRRLSSRNSGRGPVVQLTVA